MGNGKISRTIFFFAVAAGLLFFCSMTSPLFAIHNRVDQNIFMTVGKGMMDGKVLYRDLFEQKGPLLYFIHGLAYLISGYNFTGVYLLEIVCMGLFLVYVNKIILLYTDRKSSVIMTLIAAILIMTSNCFLRGDNAEEFCLPLLAFSLFHLIVICRQSHDMPSTPWICLTVGFLAGCVLWIKYTMLGFWAVWIIWAVWRLLKTRCYQKAIICCIAFGSGMMVATLPWIIYFAANHAINDWLFTYFYANIFLYSGIEPLLRLVMPFGATAMNLALNPLLLLVMFVGIRDLYGRKKVNTSSIISDERRAVGLSFLALYIGLYIGGTYYDYYVLISSIFCVYGLLSLQRRFGNTLSNMHARCRGKWTIAMAVLLTFYTLIMSNCAPFYFYHKNDYVQYQFADIMAAQKEDENLSMLNYGFIDGGFYMAAETEPIHKYISSLNLDPKKYPELDDTLRNLMENKIPEFVVARTHWRETVSDITCDELMKCYHLIAVGVNKPDHYRYYLFQRN